MSRSSSELGRTPAAYTPAYLAEKILASRHAISGERKQVTVLFCDIVDSTSLAELMGPESMHALLDGFFERALVEDASGRSRILTKAGKATRAGLRHSKAARNYLPRATRVHGSFVWLKGDHAAARKWWQRSLVAAEQSGVRYDLGLTELEMGRRLTEPARLERAAGILGEIGAPLDLSKANAALESIER